MRGHQSPKLLREKLAIALVLLANVAQRILRSAPVELVDRHKIGKIEHVDFFELRGGAEFGRHHVQRAVGQRDDRRVALTDARGLDNDQIEACHLASRDRIGQRLGDLGSSLARRHRSHVDVRMLDGVHADAVAEQRATRLAP